MMMETLEQGRIELFEFEDHALRLWRIHGGDERALPPVFVTARELDPMQHLEMQGALQAWVDNAISKTINIDAGCMADTFARVCMAADRLGLKGVTLYRPGARAGAVLEGADGMAGANPPVYCALELKQAGRGGTT